MANRVLTDEEKKDLAELRQQHGGAVKVFVVGRDRYTADPYAGDLIAIRKPGPEWHRSQSRLNEKNADLYLIARDLVTAIAVYPTDRAKLNHLLVQYPAVVDDIVAAAREMASGAIEEVGED